MTTKEMIAVMQAWTDGKRIQARLIDKDDWIDVFCLDWNWEKYEYRIKPEEEKPVRMTNRQLAEWCSMGKGLWKHGPSNSGTVYHYYWFNESKMNKELPDCILIMPKDSDEWIEPTVDIYNRDCKGE